MHFIFRKSDGVHLYTAQNRPGSLSDQLKALDDNEPGTRSDYVIIEEAGPVPHGDVPTMVGNKVVFVANPKRVERETRRDWAVAELTALGISPETIRTILGTG